MVAEVKRYRVWWIPQIPMKPFTVDVDDLKTAWLLMNVLADYDIFQYENRIKPDYSNVGGIQEWNGEAGEWQDMEDEDVEELLREYDEGTHDE